MSLSRTTFIGIDPSGGRHPFSYAALDEDCHLIALAAGEIEEVLAFLGSQEATVVAINAPRYPNRGLVRKLLEKQNLPPGHLRGSDLRMAEYELRDRGISVSPTSSRVESCATWVQIGFDLYRTMEEKSCKPFPSGNATHQWIETHPYAAYCALLGQLPLPRPTMEGRLQRQLALYEQEVGIKDPMDFFEEITRHKLLKGVLPTEFIYIPEELDAMVAAFTAYLAANQPERVVRIGDPQEGQITLPVSGLKESYS
jgi:predicted nuclease with RNAse H fold